MPKRRGKFILNLEMVNCNTALLLFVLCFYTDVQISVASEKELYRARFWQGFQNSVESDSAIGRGKVGYPVLKINVLSNLCFNLMY